MFLSSRRLIALLVAGVAVIAVALWVSSRNPSAGAADAGQPVLPGLESSVNSITQVKLIKGDGTHTTLEKKATDWIVGERDFPADSGRVRKLLLNLASLEVVEEKTSDPASYSQIGVEDVTSPKAAGTRIEIDEPGKTMSLIVGNPSGSDSSFVRVSGAKQSLLASPQLTPETDPRRWLDSSVFTLPESRVKAVEVKPASGPAYIVTRATAKQTDFTVPHLPKGRELTSASAPDSVAGALASLTLDDVRQAGAATTADARETAGGTHGKLVLTKSRHAQDAKSRHGKSGDATTPLEHAVFQTFDGLTVDVTGQKDGDSRYIALSAQSSEKGTADEAKQLNARLGGWQIEIPGYQYDAIFQPLDGLLKKPEPKAVKAKGHKGSRLSRHAKEKAAA